MSGTSGRARCLGTNHNSVERGLRGSDGFVSELLEVGFEGGGKLRIESGCDGVEGLVGLAFVHEVDAFSGGVLCAYEKVFVEVVAGVGLFLADFHRAH